MLPGAAGAETSIWVVTDSSPTVAVAPAAALARDRVLPVSAAERAVAVHSGGASARVPAVMPARSCEICGGSRARAGCAATSGSVGFDRIYEQIEERECLLIG